MQFFVLTELNRTHALMDKYLCDVLQECLHIKKKSYYNKIIFEESKKIMPLHA